MLMYICHYPSYLWCLFFPEYKEYCGLPVHSIRSMYGMTLSSKYWYLDLLGFLLTLKFIPSKSMPCLFIKEGKKGGIFFSII
jgi:hypothetical protein